MVIADCFLGFFGWSIGFERLQGCLLDEKWLKIIFLVKNNTFKFLVASMVTKI